MKPAGGTFFILFLVWVLSLPAGTAAEPGLSDAQKLQTVYRMYYQEYKAEFQTVRDVVPQEAMEWLARGQVVFVDTRKPAERQVSMLPASVSKAQFLQSPQMYTDKKVVGYCTISYRSGLFAKEMAEKGVTVYNLAGGILAWTLEGGKIYDPSGNETRRLHVYGDKWDYAPEGFETVKFSLWEQLFSSHRRDAKSAEKKKHSATIDPFEISHGHSAKSRSPEPNA
jgi:sodium/bile acid cotransporter 7